jgi:hypothetical protein
VTVLTVVRQRGTAILEGWIDGTGDLRSLVPLRLAVGPLVFLHLRPFLEAALDGRIYRDTFFQPYVAWYPELPRSLYIALLWVVGTTAAMVSLGLFTRVAAALTAGGVAYNLFLSETHFHHNRAFLLILLIGVALMPLGRFVSVDAVLRRRRGSEGRPGPAPLWPLALLRFEVAVAYWASGLSKLIDQDWWSGLVLRLRIEQYGALAAERGTPEWLLDLLSGSTFVWWFAKVVVLTELAIGIGLFWHRSRLLAVWLAIGFHLAIEVTAEVQVFSAAGLAALVIWVTPRAGDRVLRIRADRRGARLLGAAARTLDWTGRFRIREVLSGPAVRLDDRPSPSGTPVVRTGPGAAVMVLSRLPATFWFAAPLVPLLAHRGRPHPPRSRPPGRSPLGSGAG